MRNLVSTREITDLPHNAILLRADIHSLFDDYQWGVWVRELCFFVIFLKCSFQIEQGELPHRILRFEKSGATVLDGYPNEVNFSAPSLRVVDPPNLTLLQQHFCVCLILHVRGFGRPSRPGSTMI